MPSFRFNIDPEVALRAPGRLATVTALLNCPEGHEASITVTLSQGARTAQTQRRAACALGLERHPIFIAAQGKSPFSPGSAVVEAEVVVFDRGHPIDTQRWTRQVQIALD